MSKEKNEETVPELIVLTHDIDGNPFLPDQQPSAVKELWLEGKKHVENKEQHAKLTTALKEGKESLKALYRKYPSFFIPSENDPNVLIYTIGGLTVEIDREETFEVKTRKDAPPPISTAAQNQADADKLKRGGSGRGGKKKETPADIY